MICVINGMFIKNDEKIKMVDGKEVKEPFVVIYSGDQAVTIPNCSIPDGKPGVNVDVLCDVKLSEWDGRKYLSIKPL